MPEKLITRAKFRTKLIKTDIITNRMIQRQSHAFAIAKMTLSFQKYVQICANDRKFQAKNKPRHKSVSRPKNMMCRIRISHEWNVKVQFR